jgi:hypothetical protein
MSKSKQRRESSYHRLQALYQRGVTQILDFSAGMNRSNLVWWFAANQCSETRANESMPAANLAFCRQIR